MADYIIFLDRDGTLKPEPPVIHPGLAMLRAFHEVAFGRESNNVNKYLRRLFTVYNVRFVLNSRNPEPIAKPKGRLQSRNGRGFTDPAAEHIRLQAECGIPDELLLPGHPEVVHRSNKTKGESDMEFLRRRNFPIERAFAFDNDLHDMRGFPSTQIIPVNPEFGITRVEYDQMKALIEATASLKISQRPSPPKQ